MDQTKKPVFILTGFLGAGKTTLLNRMLQQETWADTLVIVNEFGEVPLDHHLIENSSDTILELSNGCVCCSVRGELVETLLSLDPSRFKQVIIETTGLADPLPILQTLMMEQNLASVYNPSGVIAVVDALKRSEWFEKYPEAQKQVALADVVVLTKQDLSEEKSGVLYDSLTSLNPWVQLINDHLEVTPQNIAKFFSKDKVISSSVDQHHTSQYQSIVLECEAEMSTQSLTGLLQQLSYAMGEDLLRLKGLVKIDESPEKPLLAQVSGGFIHAFEQIEKWPQGIESTKLVVITKAGDARFVSTVFNAFTGKVDIDSPDQAALTDNPLAILGMG